MITYKSVDGSSDFLPLTHWRSIVLNDISLSSWNYMIAYGSANGSVHLTAPIKSSHNNHKKLDNFVSNFFIIFFYF